MTAGVDPNITITPFPPARSLTRVKTAIPLGD